MALRPLGFRVAHTTPGGSRLGAVLPRAMAEQHSCDPGRQGARAVGGSAFTPAALPSPGSLSKLGVITRAIQCPGCK